MRQSRLKKCRAWCRTVERSLYSAFRKTTVKNAFHTVTFRGNRKEYACFFLAILFIQIGFWTLSLTTDAELEAKKSQIADKYDYHFEVVNLNEEQTVAMNNVLKILLDKADPYFKNATVREEADGTYTIRVTALEGVEPSETLGYVRALLNKNIGSGWVIQTSPLYDYESEYRVPSIVAFWSIALGWTVLALAALIILFFIRLDYFRFTYGIYMTCGADFPMLYGTAAGELTAISVLTFIPAALIGFAVTAGLYIPRGVSPAFSARTAVAVPILCLAVVLLAVAFPMRRLSEKPPVYALMAKDNAGLVTSPRRSFRLFCAAFPSKYELATMWRMRKYYIRLLVSAVLFASMFVTGLYIAELQTDMNKIASYEYVITTEIAESDMNAEGSEIMRTDGDYFLPEINAVEGVGYVWWKTTLSAGNCNAHLLIHPYQTGVGVGGVAVPSSERESAGYTMAVSNYEYTAVDKQWLDMVIDNGLCTVEGDPYAVLTDSHSVVITEDVYNQAAYTFRVGDTVTVAQFLRWKKEQLPDQIPDPQELLRQQIAKAEFLYEEFTVCAVLHGLPAESNITFGVNYETFYTISDNYPMRNEFEVYMENDASDETVRAADAQIRRLVGEMGDWKVSRTGNFFRAKIMSERNGAGLTVTLGALLLLISPLVWLFSQIMFYRKRRGEFDMLFALGAPKDTLPIIFRLTGGVLSGLAFIATVLLSCLCNWVVYMLVTVLLPLLHITEAVSYTYTLSVPALVACVAVSIVCGFMSCEIPYRFMRRNTYTQRRDY